MRRWSPGEKLAFFLENGAQAGFAFEVLKLQIKVPSQSPRWGGSEVPQHTPLVKSPQPGRAGGAGRGRWALNGAAAPACGPHSQHSPRPPSPQCKIWEASSGRGQELHGLFVGRGRLRLNTKSVVSPKIRYFIS